VTTGRDLERLARGRHIAQIRAVFNLLRRGAPESDHQALDDARLMLEDSAHHAFRDLTRQTDRPSTQTEHQE
jgi:hypothetical protein